MLEKVFTKRERKVIHHLASKPKLRKRLYMVWKCVRCKDEFYFQPIKCPICEARITAVKRYTTFLEYPLMRYSESLNEEAEIKAVKA